MKLITLSSKEVKYSLNDDGTLIIRIGEDYLFKISWAELRSLDMIISGQQSESLGLAKSMIEKLKKGLDIPHEPEIESTPVPIAESIFDKETKQRFIKFLESYLSEDESVEVFEAEEIKAVLGQEFLLSELEEEFGPDYTFKELSDNRISAALLVTESN
jgi:uncharacterized protein (DUF2164 family)